MQQEVLRVSKLSVGQLTNPTEVALKQLLLRGATGNVVERPKPIQKVQTSGKPLLKNMGMSDPSASCQALASTSAPARSYDQFCENWGITDIVGLTDIESGVFLTKTLYSPTNPYEIGAAIQEAEANGKTIRALGSGWSFSGAAVPQEQEYGLFDPFGFADESNFGYAIDTSAISAPLQYLLPQILGGDLNPEELFFVEGGMKLSDINDYLNNQNPPVALKTLGGSSGQSIAGAISTGTHGSDFDRPPLADNVRAIYLIGAGGVHHWIEPAERRVADPNKLSAVFPCLGPNNIHYDDAMFSAALVSMGAMGVIYAVIVDVVPQFALIQFNSWLTWEKLLTPDVGGANLAGAVVESNWLFGGLTDYLNNFYPTYPQNLLQQYGNSRALQVVVNPIKNDDGTHNCYVTIRFEFPIAQIPNLLQVVNLPQGVVPGNLGTITLDEILNACNASPDASGSGFSFNLWVAANIDHLPFPSNDIVTSMRSFLTFCEWHQYSWAVRAVTDLIMQTTFPSYVDPDYVNPQIDLGYRVMSGSNAFGTSFSPFQVTSMETGFAFQDAIGFVTSALGVCDASVDNDVYPAGYISLRACGQTNATMGMQQFQGAGGFPDVTGMVEISMLGSSADYGLIANFEGLALGAGGLLHWGQSNGTASPTNIQSSYANLAQWQAVQRTLGGATFTNLFMRRLGLA